MDNIIKLLLNSSHVKIGSQGTQTFLVKVHAHAKKTQCATKKDDTNVEAFAALDTGDNPDEHVIIGTRRAHAGPPPRSNASLPGGRAGMPGMPRGEQRGQ